MRHLWFPLAVLLGGCGDSAANNSGGNGGSSSTGACMVGFAGCPCSDDGLCLDGLACVDQQCVGGQDSATDGVPTGSASDSASADTGATLTAATQSDSESAAQTGDSTAATASASDPSTATTVSDSASSDSSDSASASSDSDSSDSASSVSGDSVSSDSASASDTSSSEGSTDTAGGCGDGVADAGEMCDGGDLGGKTCDTMGFQFGELGCTPDCAHDTSTCTNSAACGDGIVVPGVLCYGPMTQISWGNQFVTLGLADLNKDGHLDFLGGSHLEGMSVWFGDGDGAFEPTKHFKSIMMRPDHAVDLDKDGDLELIGDHLGASKIQVVLGDGSGNLALGADYDTFMGMDKLDLADVDADGWLDMVVCGAENSKVVGFRRGQPNAMFGPLVSYPVDPTYGGYTCGFADFDGDGDLDIWTVVGAVGGSVFRILDGDGDGGFALDPAKIGFPGARFAHAAHLDGDEYFDVVGFSYKNGPGELAVRHGVDAWLGDMLYTFPIEAEQQREGFLGNFDGNAIVDVLVRSEAGPQLEIFRGDGTGLFHDGVPIEDMDNVISAMAVGDLNEDGLDDFVTTRFYINGPQFAKQHVILSNP